MKTWLRSWYITIRMWLFDRETYRHLGEPIDPEDFVEVERPSTPVWGQCEFRWFTVVHPYDPERDFDRQTVEHRCPKEATTTMTYTHPDLIRVHGESEVLCDEHVKFQQGMEELSRHFNENG